MLEVTNIVTVLEDEDLLMGVCEIIKKPGAIIALSFPHIAQVKHNHE